MKDFNTSSYAGRTRYDAADMSNHCELTFRGCRMVSVEKGRAVFTAIASNHGVRTTHFQLPPGSLITVSSSRVGVPCTEQDIFYGRSPVGEEVVEDEEARSSFTEIPELDDAIEGLCPEVRDLTPNNRMVLVETLRQFMKTDEELLEGVSGLLNKDAMEHLISTKMLARKQADGCFQLLFLQLQRRAEDMLSKIKCP